MYSWVVTLGNSELWLSFRISLECTLVTDLHAQELVELWKKPQSIHVGELNEDTAVAMRNLHGLLPQTQVGTPWLMIPVLAYQRRLQNSESYRTDIYSDFPFLDDPTEWTSSVPKYLGTIYTCFPLSCVQPITGWLSAWQNLGSPRIQVYTHTYEVFRLG